jgi:predicted MFS family arabinose efflux permease
VSLRWRILILLFLLRCLMAFQFATIGAIAPLIENTFRVDAAAIGALIGIYFTPGIVVALAGGTFAGYLGDKRIVLGGLALMAGGAALMAFADSWSLQNTGRFVAGIGGVILNVVMSKMVMDWFAKKEIATAMTIFINSWPAGIGLALIVQPIIAQSGGIFASYGIESILASIGFLALLLCYRSPAQSNGDRLSKVAFPKGMMLAAIVTSGMVWGLFNAAIAIVFSFTPTLLVEQGSSLKSAGATTSLVMWGILVTGILGGIIADRVARPQLILVAATLVFAALLLTIPRLGGDALIVAAAGLASGLCVGPIMMLPAKILSIDTRATGMGIFYMLYYICFAISPWLSGIIINLYGTERVFDFGAAITISYLGFLWLCMASSRRLQPS